MWHDYTAVASIVVLGAVAALSLLANPVQSGA
jgi:hypothetical protein